jgi:uncharacterized RDD family membrane protein YckC
MRCPKCQYISFDSGNRCRNCGYEFSLTVEPQELDLPIQTGDEAIGPLGDLSLTGLDDAMPAPASVRQSATPAWNEPATRTSPPAAAPRADRRPAPASLELPLFKDRAVDDDAPLVAPSAVPRAPLSVRRSGPPMVRAQPRPAVEEPELDLEMPAVHEHVTPAGRQAGPPAPAGWTPPAPAAAAGAAPRLLAAMIDLLILGVIDAAVLYFTLQLCGLRFDELGGLPRVPLLGFLLLLNGGYFVVFTAAGGQTIGKMATGIRVVPADVEGDSSDRVPLGHAVLRAAAYAVSLLPAGLGYLPALIGQERRAIHDRLADTRVVKS